MRLIDADALKQDLLKRSFWPVIVKTAVEKAPTIEAEPVKHGRWETYFYGKELMCSVCKATFWDENGNGGSNYCPNCGCKMDLEET